MNRITSPKNSRVKEWNKLKRKKGRDKAGAFIIEGPHLIEEALKHKAEVTDLIIDKSFRIPSDWHTGNMTTWVATSSVIEELADTETPQGVVAIVQAGSKEMELSSDGSYLLLDGIQDPGNLGAIIRTADSAGADGVILGNGTVDLYNSKVLRSTQGSLFHLPIVKGNLLEWIPRMKEKGIQVFGTSLKGGIPYTLSDRISGYALILGNEANGVHEDLLASSDQNLFVPIYGQAESLNVAVAAGILLYGLKEGK
ncbi:TrmH family RNA methyltransferase [Pseudalkalibacillus salsuginis]|uniref:TrmH family RNA methyltransferase n=1 Tax=Pseudalkalibacillus salsuginis TaxID=2910972 RepID=UPI001F39628D|nr:RNA methyltransferase [Pseudalkalibacillus salsuginis]MCF6408721.1 RNA methyltransferase [Pseudalkalibacillus salsuginis]